MDEIDWMTEVAACLSATLWLNQVRIESVLRYWACRVPSADAMDAVQGIVEECLVKRPTSIGLVNAISKGNVLDYFRILKRRRLRKLREASAGFAGTNVSVGPEEGLDFLYLSDDTDVVESAAPAQVDSTNGFENDFCGAFDARAMLARLPSSVVALGEKRLRGETLSPTERQRLSRWRKQWSETDQGGK